MNELFYAFIFYFFVSTLILGILYIILKELVIYINKKLCKKCINYAFCKQVSKPEKATKKLRSDK